MTNMYTLDHSCITGYLRNNDPIKQYFCLLPYNNTSRPLIVPQEYLIHYDDFLLTCNIPTQIAKPLIVIKHIVSSPLTIKTEPTVQLSTNKRTPITNFSSFLQKLFLLWYKLNKKANINHSFHL